jgi:hypothetical protein
MSYEPTGPQDPGMHDVQATLRRLLQPGAPANPAVRALLHDYAVYHAVFVGLGGVFVVGFLALSRWSWTRLRRGASAPGGSDRSFERRTLLGFSLVSLACGVLLALVVIGNLGNALHPRVGLAGAVGSIASPPDVQQAFDEWLQTDDPDVPALVQARIDHRLTWQRPKALVSILLLAATVRVTIRTWRSLVRRSDAGAATWRDRALLGVGVATGMASLLLVVMVLGNTQASIAPLTMTLLFG